MITLFLSNSDNLTILQGVGWLCTSVFISWSIYNYICCNYNLNLVKDVIRFLLTFIIVLFLMFIIGTFNVVYCESIELVQWGEFGTISSHVGIKFTVAERAYWVILNVPPYIKGTIIGLILSDAYLPLLKRGVNTRLEFKQSTANSGYFWFVFNILSPIFQPIFNTSVRKGTQCFSNQLWTSCLPFLREYHDLWYINGIKRIPECIYDLLTPIALAHWIQGDGSRVGSGLVICTDSFTVEDTVRLMNVLMIRHRLDCTLRVQHGSPRIYIRANSMPKLRSIIMPYMCPSMLRKLGL
jgi:hypothetical protein